MIATPKCPHGCDAPQEAGTTFKELRRIPTHTNKRGGVVLGRYDNVLMRWWTCTKCQKRYAIDEPKGVKKVVKKKTTRLKGKKRGRKPKQRKSSTVNTAGG